MNSEILCDIIDSAVRDNDAWFPQVAANPFFMTACLAGEVGEVLNLLKKVERGTHPWDEEMAANVREELADAFTYLVSVAGILDIDLAKAYWAKREINNIRFSARQALESDKGEVRWAQNVPHQEILFDPTKPHLQLAKDTPTQEIPNPTEYFKARGA